MALSAVRLHKRLAGAVGREERMAFGALDGHEAHIGTRDRVRDRVGSDGSDGIVLGGL